jgi:hypothetical protein
VYVHGFFLVRLKNKRKMVIRFVNNDIEGKGKITILLHLVLMSSQKY